MIAIENSKSGKSRCVPFEQPAFVKALERMKGRPDEFVVTLNGKSPDRDTISHAFKRAANRAGLSKLRFHDLRHIAVDRFHKAGFTLDEIAAFTGHETLNMAKRYSRLDEERIRTLLKNTRLVDTDEIEPYSKGKETADGKTD